MEFSGAYLRQTYMQIANFNGTPFVIQQLEEKNFLYYSVSKKLGVFKNFRDARIVNK